ncbi:MAG: TonB-dependent receptor family protein [Ferruginibacter sp.]|nr:TonB-dependent receptor [Chitinophagaceae bacterium]MBU9937491.1 TonB-dependent receptor family protein [Ferruginibacter sp.]
MKQFFSLLAAMSIAVCSYAQSGGKVTGSIKDGGNQKIIDAASVSLLNTKDSSLVKTAVADKNGNFTFENLKDGNYLVMATSLGHSRSYSRSFSISSGQETVALEVLQLLPVSKNLQEVSVSSKKPLIERKLDRTIVNVDASITNAGNTALEVLEKSPGITVDKDGNISLKGKSGVVIYLDGRPSYLSGPDLANMLRNMTASQLEQIEIMTNPPAKYDAAGNAGVINIKTKKNKQFGYNGSITSGYTQGRYARFNESVSFNYRNQKVNFYSTLNYNRNHRSEELYITRNFRESATKEIKSIFDQKTSMENQRHYYNAKIGADFFVSKKTTLGVGVNGFYNPSTWESVSSTDIFDPNHVLTSKTGATTRNDEKWKNFSGNVNFRTVLDSAGQEITADVDYVQYSATSSQPLTSYYYDAMGNLTQAPDLLLGTLPTDIRIYSGKIDYSLPLKKGAKFEAGIKSSYVKTDNDARYDSVKTNYMVLDSGRSNHFVYDENINAAYVNYSRPLGKKWSAQLGLRLENTNANGVSKGYAFNTPENRFVYTETKFKRSYSQLFPTVYLQYTASEKNQFVINYGRRIQRPDYEDMNPFVHFIDRYTFEQGNPNLSPQFAHNIELSHTYKGFLTTTVNYTNTTNIMQQVLEQNEVSNETFIKKANIANSKQLGLAVSANKSITKWWSANVYTNVYNNHFKGVVNNDPISIGVTTFLAQMQHQFKFKKGWAAELSGFYRSKGLEGVIYIKPIAQVNAGFSKQVLKNKGSIRLNVRDIFAGGVFKGYSKYSNVDAQFRNVNDSRAVSVSFTYRFSKGKLKAGSSKKNGGASDEQNRVKSGN